MNNLIYLIIFFICCAETLAISFVKKYHNGDGAYYFPLAVCMYALVCFLLNKSFSFSGMGLTNVMWSGISVMAVTLTGVLWFHEKLHLHDILASAMITGGLLILKYTS